MPKGLANRAKPGVAGALLDRAGEFLAVVDQFADEAEDAAEAVGMSAPARGGSGSVVGVGSLRAADMNGTRT